MTIIVGMSSHFKFFNFLQTLLFPHRFWPADSHWIGYDPSPTPTGSDDASQARFTSASSSSSRGRFSYWLNWQHLTPRKAHPVLVGVASGRFALEMEEMTDAQIIEIARSTLIKVTISPTCLYFESINCSLCLVLI